MSLAPSTFNFSFLSRLGEPNISYYGPTRIVTVLESSDAIAGNVVTGGDGNTDMLELQMRWGDSNTSPLFYTLPAQIEKIEYLKLGVVEHALYNKEVTLDLSLAGLRSHFPHADALNILGMGSAGVADGNLATVHLTDLMDWEEIALPDDADYREFLSTGDKPFTLKISQDVRISGPESPWNFVTNSLRADVIYGTPQGDDINIRREENTYVYPSLSVQGGWGNDTIRVDAIGNFTLNGEEGNDILFARNGWVTMNGGEGNDSLTIAWGSKSGLPDTATGDRIYDDLNTYLAYGGEGDDLFDLEGTTFTVEGGSGHDRFLVSKAAIISSDPAIPNVIGGGAGGDDRLIFNEDGNFGDPFANAKISGIEILDLTGRQVTNGVAITLTAASLQEAGVDRLSLIAHGGMNSQVTLVGFDGDPVFHSDDEMHYVSTSPAMSGDAGVASANVITLEISKNIRIVGVNAFQPPEASGD